MTFKNPSDILDGADINQDVHYLVGYVSTLVPDAPASHLADLCEVFLNKHRPQLDLAELREKNETRANEWRRDRTTQSRTPLTFSTTELAGEVGELCNEIKKVERKTYGLAGGKTLEEAFPKICEELADVVICADLIGMKLGINLPSIVRDKFNKTSDKNGMTTKL